MIIAPRGPRSVLCVVVVMTSANPTGDGCAPPAIRPAMCAMSATSTAPTSSRDLGERGEVDGPRDSGAAAEDHLGPLLPGQVTNLVQVERPVSARTPYCTAWNHLPVTDTGQPWVR